jgi:hypothetical protein
MNKQEMLTRLSEAQALTTPEVTLPISFVIQMIESLEDVPVKETSKITINEDQIKQLTNLISDSITDAGLDLIDDYDLTMNYREVELDSIDLDSSRIEKLVKDTINDWLESANDDNDCDC